MFLKKVRICNFKSFHREEIEFLPGFNCITGPNGAGTLSVTEPKCLRVIRTNDLLQKGASTNITAAEVTLVIINNAKQFSSYPEPEYHLQTKISVDEKGESTITYQLNEVTKKRKRMMKR